MEQTSGFSRRQLLALIGQTAGAAAMYQAMTTLGFAAESQYKGPANLSAAPKGASVLVLGAGVAGMVAAYEMRAAGYKVQVLEYNERAGGRCWTLRGGDRYTELGGATQHCEFDPGLYINPGPWRIPYNHHGIMDYCKRLGVALQPFIQVNYNAYLHSKTAFGGKPQRYREVQADFQGHIAEMLGKAVNTGKLDQNPTGEDKEKLLDALRNWGALDKDYRYTKSAASSRFRGAAVPSGGGLMPLQQPSEPIDPKQLLDSGLWSNLSVGNDTEFQSSIFQPVGGMDMIAQAFQREVGDLIRFGAKVTGIQQDNRGVTVSYVDSKTGGAAQTAHADWCVCALPLSILSQIPVNVGPAMDAAIHAVPYDAAVKIGLQFKRKFWEQDEHIYGGITYTDLPIQRIGYPNTDYGKPGKGVLLGAYVFGANAFEFTAMAPQERVRHALAFGSQIHPQYAKEFDTGIAVGWNRVPWTNGCYGMWTDATRAAHYNNLCAIDGRIVLAGEHASYIPAWQEGAVLSSLDAITRLHAKILATQERT
jgi:monoamine oxidase